MSMGPARLSRRSLLRGAASATVLAALAASSSCATETGPNADAPAATSPLLRLARSVGDGAGGAPIPPATASPAIATDADVVAAIAAQAVPVRLDYADGRTATASGWLLSVTEADVLARYAGTCRSSPC